MEELFALIIGLIRDGQIQAAIVAIALMFFVQTFPAFRRKAKTLRVPVVTEVQDFGDPITRARLEVHRHAMVRCKNEIAHHEAEIRRLRGEEDEHFDQLGDLLDEIQEAS